MSQLGTAKMGAPFPAPSEPRQRAGRGWAFAAVAIVLILGGVFLNWYFISQTVGAIKSVPAGIREFAVEAARPKIFVRDIVLSSIADVQHEAKLVVLQTTVNIDVTREESGSSWGIYWGTNTARVRAPAKVQFFIDLNSLGTADVVYNESSKVVTMTVPPPKLDAEMVNMDPSKIETLDLSGGWARFDKKVTFDRAIADLRPRIIEQANKDVLLKKEADTYGKEKLAEIFRPLADTLSKDGVTVEIKYRE